MPKKDENLKENETPEVEETPSEAQIDENEAAAEPEEEKVQQVEFEQIDSLEPESTVESVNINVDHQDEANGPVTVQPVKFASFEDLSQSQGEVNKNLDILMDIKLQMTVELGRTELPIKKVLELTRGSIIELEKVAGEPVELYANGKLVAHGEVVVIEDNFGLRITSITEPEDRLKGLS